MHTNIFSRMHRRGRPSLALYLAGAAVVVVLVIAALVATGEAPQEVTGSAMTETNSGM